MMATHEVRDAIPLGDAFGRRHKVTKKDKLIIYGHYKMKLSLKIFVSWCPLPTASRWEWQSL